MIKIKKHEILGMRLMDNKILVKPNREMDELLLTEGNKIYIDPSFAQEKHVPTSGEVINVCKKLNDFQMHWKTSIEVKSGDLVFYSFEAAYDCLNDTGKIFVDENNTKYFLLDYFDLFVAKRGEEIIPVNGYVLCEPVEEELTSKIQLPEFLKRTRSDKFGRVVYLGARNTEYYLGNGKKEVRHDLKDCHEIAVGDVVLFDKNCDLPVEYDLHQSLAGRNKTFYRMHRCYIKAIVQKDFLKQFGIAQK